VVDDEHLIIGSANINDRSMEGSRDSEVCLHFYEKNSEKIRNFRLELWTTYLGEGVAAISGFLFIYCQKNFIFEKTIFSIKFKFKTKFLLVKIKILTKNSIFHQNFQFKTKFRFSPKIRIFNKTSNLKPNFYF